jgi:hypothetical protein
VPVCVPVCEPDCPPPCPVGPCSATPNLHHWLTRMAPHAACKDDVPVQP